MSQVERIRRQQVLREVEGYLELLMVFGHDWPVAPKLREPIVARALAILNEMGCAGAHQAHALYLRGQALRIAERWEEAILPLAEAAELEPQNTGHWLALAWCQKRIGRVDLAIQSLEEALAADPEQGIIYYSLACYWALQNNVSLAVEYLARAFDIDPNYRDLVKDEHDFDAIRHHPGFRAVTKVIV